MDEVRIPPAGDGFYAAARRERTSRHHRVDEGFLGILEEDYAIPRYALHNAFMGIPAEPKKSAIALCEWASGQDEPDRALLAWARKNGSGTLRPDPEDVTDNQGEA